MGNRGTRTGCVCAELDGEDSRWWGSGDISLPGPGPGIHTEQKADWIPPRCLSWCRRANIRKLRGLATVIRYLSVLEVRKSTRGLDQDAGPALFPAH